MPKTKEKRGRYIGEVRTRFNILEQWDGKSWNRPDEVGNYGAFKSKMHFDVEDALHADDDDADRAFRPR